VFYETEAKIVCSLDLEEGGENQKAVVALTLNHNGIRGGANPKIYPKQCRHAV
jgi:hypothetical protein